MSLPTIISLHETIGMAEASSNRNVLALYSHKDKQLVQQHLLPELSQIGAAVETLDSLPLGLFKSVAIESALERCASRS